MLVLRPLKKGSPVGPAPRKTRGGHHILRSVYSRILLHSGHNLPVRDVIDVRFRGPH